MQIAQVTLWPQTSSLEAGLLEFGFHQSKADSSLLFKKHNTGYLAVLVHASDMPIVGDTI